VAICGLLYNYELPDGDCGREAHPSGLRDKGHDVRRRFFQLRILSLYEPGRISCPGGLRSCRHRQISGVQTAPISVVEWKQLGYVLEWKMNVEGLSRIR
jgi:hypothetical protein